jgi:hypothetical protein
MENLIKIDKNKLCVIFFMKRLIDLLVTSLQIDKKIKKYEKSNQLGWIANFLLILTKET